MAGTRYEGGDHACCCERSDGSCAGLAVRRLGSERVRELAEEIWTASNGRAIPTARVLDLRTSRPGASARAAYQRHRQEELLAWRQRRWWRAGAVAAATIGGGVLIGLTVGAWLGWPMALVAGLATGWHLRFRPSASATVWRRQAAAQRRTGDALQPLEREGYLVLHDVTLPGSSASLDHLVVGPSGVWIIRSGQRARARAVPGGFAASRPHGTTGDLVPGLRWQAAAIEDILAGGSSIPVRPLLCIPGRPAPPAIAHGSVDRVQVTSPRQLHQVIRQGSPLPPELVELATARALELLRPAA